MDQGKMDYKEQILNETEREIVSRLKMRSALTLMCGQDDKGDPDESWRKFIFRRRLHSVLRTSMKAVSMLLVAALFFFGGRKFQATTSSGADVPVTFLTTSAPVGHMAKCVLPDGTEVTLNANSKLTYPSFFLGDRRVSLEGEAFFNVSADPDNPFIVSTDKLSVKALGTKFNVSSYKNDNYVVSLLEGAVFIYHESREESGLYLEPNEQLVESGGGYLKKVFVQDPAMWVNGFYVFNNCGMETILSKLELYYDVKIVALNERLLNKTYTGKFRQTDGVREILNIMSRIYPFTIKEDESSNTIYIQ